MSPNCNGTAYLFADPDGYDHRSSINSCREDIFGSGVGDSITSDVREELLMRKILQEEVRKMIDQKNPN